MKRFIYKSTTALIIFGLLVFYSGCDQLEKLTQFTMDYNSTIVVPSSVVVDLPINLNTPDIQSNSESTFAINDTRKDLIEQIILRELTLTITSPNGADFSFLNSAKIYIKADGLSDVEIAYIGEVPESIGATLSLETTGVDIQEYIKKDKFTLRMSTVTDELIASDHEIDLYSKFFVDARILGL